MIQFISLVSFSLLAPIAGFYFAPALTREILRDLRLPRILHYVMLAGLGMALFLQTHLPESMAETALFAGRLSLLAVSLAFAAVFAIVTNNITDLETDKISNTSRPLVKGTVQTAAYLKAGWLCLLTSIIISGLAHPAMLAGVLAISGGYYVYSCPPFRWKRYPFLAKMLIGFNSLAVAVCGFVLAGGQWHDFPLSWLLFIMLPLSLAANFVDLKDTEGDRLAQVKTLPVLWGEKKARQFISFSTVLTYYSAVYLLQKYWLLPLVSALCFAHIYLLYRQPYQEKPVFGVYLTGLLGLIFFLFL